MLGLETLDNRSLLYVLNLLVVIYLIYLQMYLTNDAHVYQDITPRVNQWGKAHMLADEHAYGGIFATSTGAAIDPTTYGWQRIQPALQTAGIRYIDNSPTGNNSVPQGDTAKYWIPFYISTYDDDPANWNTPINMIFNYGIYIAGIGALLVLISDIQAYTGTDTIVLAHPSPLVVHHDK